MPSTYTKPNPRTHKRRDYDRQILSDADYAALQGYQADYQNATTDAQRQQAHQAAEDLRNSYGYSLGADGATFTVAGRPGVSQETNLHLLQLEQGPQWSQDYDAAYHELLTRLENRAFSYDPATDPLYARYSEAYQAQGRAAMRDTVAETSALTGGYASTYAASAGQQAYSDQLSALAAQLPALYELALNRYNAEGSNIKDQLQLLSSQQQAEQTRYDQQLAYWQSQAQQERTDAQTALAQSQSAAASAAANQTQAQQNAWRQAMDSISLGVVPSAALLAAAGISQAWAQSMANTAHYRIYK